MSSVRKEMEKVVVDGENTANKDRIVCGKNNGPSRDIRNKKVM